MARSGWRRFAGNGDGQTCGGAPAGYAFAAQAGAVPARGGVAGGVAVPRTGGHGRLESRRAPRRCVIAVCRDFKPQARGYALGACPASGYGGRDGFARRIVQRAAGIRLRFRQRSDAQSRPDQRQGECFHRRQETRCGLVPRAVFVEGDSSLPVRPARAQAPRFRAAALARRRTDACQPASGREDGHAGGLARAPQHAVRRRCGRQGYARCFRHAEGCVHQGASGGRAVALFHGMAVRG